MSLEQKAQEMAEALKATREYVELKQAKNSIDINRELKSKVEEFKRKELLYATNNLGKEMDAKTAELAKAFESLSKVPEINKFLKAERDFGNLLQKVYGTINNAIQSGLNSK